MKKILWCILLLFIFFPLQSQVKNEDRPQRGNWDFKPEKVWEIKQAGTNDFGRIAELLISNQGNIYVRDFEHSISYIFDKDGQFLGSFAKQGSAEEELSRYLNRFLAEDKIVLGTPEKLVFYTEDVTVGLHFRFIFIKLNPRFYFEYP